MRGGRGGLQKVKTKVKGSKGSSCQLGAGEPHSQVWTGGGGGLFQVWIWEYPYRRSGSGYPPPGQVIGQDGGTLGYPPPRTGWDTPLPRTGWGTPIGIGWGVTPLHQEIEQHSEHLLAAGGVLLAFMREDFLVLDNGIQGGSARRFA